MPSPHVKIILDRINEIHNRKSNDYAQENNPFSNFERSGELASWFNDPIHRSFAVLIGVKLARLAELLNGKRPKNESIDDSFLDLCTYCVLFHSYYLTSLDPTHSESSKELNATLKKQLKEMSEGTHLWMHGKCTKCGETLNLSNSRYCDERLLKSDRADCHFKFEPRD